MSDLDWAEVPRLQPEERAWLPPTMAWPHLALVTLGAERLRWVPRDLSRCEGRYLGDLWLPGATPADVEEAAALAHLVATLAPRVRARLAKLVSRGGTRRLAIL